VAISDPLPQCGAPTTSTLTAFGSDSSLLRRARHLLLRLAAEAPRAGALDDGIAVEPRHKLPRLHELIQRHVRRGEAGDRPPRTAAGDEPPHVVQLRKAVELVDGHEELDAYVAEVQLGRVVDLHGGQVKGVVRQGGLGREVLRLQHLPHGTVVSGRQQRDAVLHKRCLIHAVGRQVGAEKGLRPRSCLGAAQKPVLVAVHQPKGAPEGEDGVGRQGMADGS
jgi:hypothetical protein